MTLQPDRSFTSFEEVKGILDKECEEAQSTEIVGAHGSATY